jgi:hypothetical protein
MSPTLFNICIDDLLVTVCLEDGITMNCAGSPSSNGYMRMT